MSEQAEIAVTPDAVTADSGIGAVLVNNVSDALGALDEARVCALVEDLRAPDLADLIELLQPGERSAFVQALGKDFDYDVLSELDETVRDQLAEELPNEYLALAVTELDTDDAAYLVESLEPEDQAEVLARLSATDRTALLRNLEYEEETAGRLMQSDFVAVAPFWDVGQVIDYMRDTDDLPEHFSEIFVVDPSFKVMGTVDLSRLLRSKRQTRIEEIMDDDIVTVVATDDQEEVGRKFERYDLMSAPVVDENNRLVGVVTVDDVVEVIQSEADEDIRRLGGVGDESVLDTVFYTTRNRFIWLLVNLGTAVLASAVIKLFDASI
ncbi:MAG: magnesium transporter, partial [Hyphomicrobiaceae bacterium]|nr:magnesium transporter [Hyphomicrobiaceae bacterium]